MDKGRGSALVFLCVTVLMMAVCSRTAEGAIYVVGDARGWTFNVVNWPAGKRFRVGDVLVFNYSPAFHNVAQVNALGYRLCVPGPGPTIRRSGRDRITLRRGTNYFICGIPGHCAANMKIAVTAF